MTKLMNEKIIYKLVTQMIQYFIGIDFFSNTLTKPTKIHNLLENESFNSKQQTFSLKLLENFYLV
jgi:hypothetical protein